MSSPRLSTVEELLEEEEVVEAGGRKEGEQQMMKILHHSPPTGAVAEAKAAWCRAALALALGFLSITAGVFGDCIRPFLHLFKS